MVTGWDILWIFVVLVVGSFIAGAVETWWEQRKWNKKREKWSSLPAASS
ncbi:hypothetical protein ES703_97131 [subsurface metagenome]